MPDQIYYRKYNATTGKNLLAKLNADVAAMFADSASIEWSYDTVTGVLTGTSTSGGITAADLDAILRTANGISKVIDYEATPDKVLLTFENAPGEGLVVIADQVYVDDEVAREDLRGMDDNYQEFTYLKESVEGDTIGCDLVEINPDNANVHQFDPHEHFFIHGDPNYYFLVHLEAEWSIDPDDNDASIDFQANNIWCQFVTRPRSTYNSDVSLWDKSFSKECAWATGTTIAIDETFIFEATEQTYVGFNLSDDDTMAMDTLIRPIANYALFWKRITVTRHLKTNWFHRFDIPASDLDAVSLKSCQLPSGAGEGLPFNGFYDCFVSVKVKEEDSVGGVAANCGTMQTLEVQGFGDSKIQIARSGVNVMVTPPNVDKWMNRHLGGSAKVYVTDSAIANRRITIEVNLPNGVNKQLVGGYIHLQYRGENEGMIRI